MHNRFHAELIPERDGCLSGVADAGQIAAEIGARLSLHFKEGERVIAGLPVGEIIATPEKIALSEEKIVGSMAKLSGIATAAQRAVALAKGRTKLWPGHGKKCLLLSKKALGWQLSVAVRLFGLLTKPWFI
jgi:nicotinate-nucleotide pyrophosphorylase (carboxylating)